MEKPQLVNFIAKVMEESGFKVYKDFKTSQKVLDIYAILPTTIGDFGVVVACKNYDKEFNVGIDVLREMEEVGETLKAAKVTIVTSSYFTEQATNYALRKNIKLVDRNNLLEMANKFSSKANHSTQSTLDNNFQEEEPIEEDNFEDESVQYDDYYGQYFDSRYDDVDSYDYFENRTRHQPIHEHDIFRPNPSPGLFKGGRKSLSAPIENRGNSRRSFENFTNPNFNAPTIPTFNVVGTFSQLIKNPIFSILVVVLVSYGLSALLGSFLKISSGICGLIELVIALLLSYLLALNSERDSYFIVKGTVIFFISLIILIILILL